MVMHAYITPAGRITGPGTARLPSRRSSNRGNTADNRGKLLVPDAFALLLAKTAVWRNLWGLWLAKQMGVS